MHWPARGALAGSRWPAGIGRQQLAGSNWPAAIGWQELAGRHLSAGIGRQEVDVRDWLAGIGLQGLAGRQAARLPSLNDHPVFQGCQRSLAQHYSLMERAIWHCSMPVVRDAGMQPSAAAVANMEPWRTFTNIHNGRRREKKGEEGSRREKKREEGGRRAWNGTDGSRGQWI